MPGPSRVTFHVQAPAMRPPMGNAPPIPDAVPIYTGSASPVSGQCPTQIGAATIVSAGAPVGSKWYGCTYISGPHSIPGMGYVELS